MLSSLLESRTKCRAQQHATNALDRAWLQSLDRDCRRDIQHRRSTHRRPLHAQFNNRIVELMDQMMLRLHKFAVEFNLAVEWNLHVTATPPSFVTETLSFNSFREPAHSITTYRARLATRLWSLILRAERNRLEFFLIPTQSVLGLSKIEHEYPPFSIISFDGESLWHDGKPFSERTGIEALCRFIFRMLVSKCIQDAERKEGDPLAALYKEAQAGGEPPSGKEPGATASSRQEDLQQDGLHVTKNLMESNIMTTYDVYNDVLLCFTFLGERVEVAISELADMGAHAFRRRDLNAVKRCCLDLVAAQTNEAKVHELRGHWIEMKEISELLAECTEYGAPSHKHDPASSNISNDVPGSLRCLIESVDVVAQAMVEGGAKAFGARDFERVERYRRLAISVVQFKARVESLRDEWCTQVPDPSHADATQDLKQQQQPIRYVNSIKAISLAAS